LLKKRPPQLCQQCHSQDRHPSVQYDGSAVTSRSPYALVKGCLNCHFQVHGSNHPSGVKLLR
jgi:nitrate/TMAO reductase-like tetraheme cytochrome c subunit